jgi:hypothetical protein
MEDTSVGSWVTEPQDAASTETREVYAHAGLALYLAQCLEHEIVNSLGVVAIVRMLSKKWPVTSTEIGEYESQVDQIWDEHFERTLGQLLKSLSKSNVEIPSSLDSDLRESLEMRNRLVHRYFRERAEAWFQRDGKKAMTDELKLMQEQFMKTDHALHEVTSKIRNACGMTEETTTRVAELMKTGASDQEIDQALSKPREDA